MLSAADIHVIARAREFASSQQARLALLDLEHAKPRPVWLRAYEPLLKTDGGAPLQYQRISAVSLIP